MQYFFAVFSGLLTCGDKQVYAAIIRPNILGKLKMTGSSWSHRYLKTLICGRTEEGCLNI